MTTTTEARDRLRAALYRASVPWSDERCDTCAHRRDTGSGITLDYHCALHGAPVSASGVCQQWARGGGADAS